jgi:hypothetical protein
MSLPWLAVGQLFHEKTPHSRQILRTTKEIKPIYRLAAG